MNLYSRYRRNCISLLANYHPFVGDCCPLNCRSRRTLNERLHRKELFTLVFFCWSCALEFGFVRWNGYFDGDMYWVSRNPELLDSFKVRKPWRRIYSTPSVPSKKPNELSVEEFFFFF
ncbi:uncharacterized protein LOC131299031 isoform X2 [Rhododendron vialii]|uniref:uncharacterized protein LOC131299031 isoform X2 n=1 Tax=Rhododendron vialii TaxID=182163 RepID=UPI00265FA065|nr:uncharacterized protein LOC131299031 isoform X2 [Rhododendron vialii]